MKKLKTATTIFIVAVLCAACESRKDVYMSSVEQVEIYLNSDELGQNANGDYECELLNGSSIEFPIGFTNEIMAESRKLEYSAVVKNGDNPDYFTCELFPETMQLKVTNNVPLNNNLETLPFCEIHITVSDYFGRQNSKKLIVRAKNNGAASFSVSATVLDDAESSGMSDSSRNMAYLICVSDAIDPEGDTINEYEFNIGGKIIYNNEGYEGEYEQTENPNPYHAAMGGTYISERKESCVKHVFQQTGSNEIHVRVKDGRGLWSKWNTITVNL